MGNEVSDAKEEKSNRVERLEFIEEHHAQSYHIHPPLACRSLKALKRLAEGR